MCLKLSVIVPIYNKMEYLNKALTSIANQTYRDLEIILVDDGSTDDSKVICSEFCKEDKRFKYYYKKNGGVASARNFGLAMSTGEYIGFVDPDDYIEESMYQKLIHAAMEKNYDIVSCGINVLDNGTVTRLANANMNELSVYDAVSHLLKWDGIVTPYLWNKIFRKECVKNIRFNEALCVGEDIPFIFENILQLSTKYGHINECLYNYIRNENSLVGVKYKSSSARSSIQSSFFISEICESKYREYINLSQYSLLLNCYFQMCSILHEDDYKKFKDDFAYFSKVISKINPELIDMFGNRYLKFKVMLCVRLPRIYKNFIRIKKRILL